MKRLSPTFLSIGNGKMKICISRFLLPFLALLLTFEPLAAMTIQYKYDSGGRITMAEYTGVGSINYRYDAAGNITDVTILVNGSTVVDSDQDGIDDAWERLYFDDLAVLSAQTDYDKDGYSDLWEYLNWRDGLVDANGNSFNPTLKNAPGARGYRVGVSSPGFWNMVLPALLKANAPATTAQDQENPE